MDHGKQGDIHRKKCSGKLSTGGCWYIFTQSNFKNNVSFRSFLSIVLIFKVFTAFTDK